MSNGGNNRIAALLSKTIVLVVAGVVIGALIVWDVFLASDDITGNTWSELLREAGLYTPVVPWLCGVLIGHLFHPKDRTDPLVSPPGNAVLLVWASLVITLLGFPLTIPPWLPVPFGAVTGALLWPVHTEHKRLQDILGWAR